MAGPPIPVRPDFLAQVIELAEIITALEAVGLNCLVMGGHAVRFYGLDRNTVRHHWNSFPRRIEEPRSCT